MVRPKQEDLGGIEGPGVAPVKFKDIDRLADRFIETLDELTGLKTSLEELEQSILGKMEEHSVSVYRFSDRQITIKAGEAHIKIKAFKEPASPKGFEIDPDDEP